MRSRTAIRMLSTLLILVSTASLRGQDSRPDEWLEAVLGAARFLEREAIETPDGLAWPRLAGDKATLDRDLYAGSAGVVFFMANLARTDLHPKAAEIARRGAADLAAHFTDCEGAGLYEGLAGRVFAVSKTAEALGDRALAAKAADGLRLLVARAVRTGDRLAWNESNDIISGTAGIGLVLLELARDDVRELAHQAADGAGRELVARGERSKDGLFWKMTDRTPRLMPNFSHGTAGVAYFLARLGEETKLEAAKTAAARGAIHLLGIADTASGGIRIAHHTPGGEALYYVGWCHGPAGTARLFDLMHRTTGDRNWLVAVKRAAAFIASSGFLEGRAEGLWKNPGYCCGLAGVAQFLADWGRIAGGADATDLSTATLRALLDGAERTAASWNWKTAEHRTRPDEITVQCGFMQGAAGIGAVLLDAYARKNRLPRCMRLPDDPF